MIEILFRIYDISYDSQMCIHKEVFAKAVIESVGIFYPNFLFLHFINISGINC